MRTKATIFKIKGGANLRTSAMKGSYLEEPKIGKGFIIYGKGIIGGIRCIYTSDVVKIDTTRDGWIIYTRTGSEYGIKNNHNKR